MRKIAENKTVAEAVKLLIENHKKRIAIGNRPVVEGGGYLMGFYIGSSPLPNGARNDVLDYPILGCSFYVSEIKEKPKYSLHKYKEAYPFSLYDSTQSIFTIYEQD